jgi:tRNA threonylcarbamoyladenosine biosynthesis protein TsaE
MEITTQSPEETKALGKQIGQNLILGDVVLLFGNLGVGKTALVQGIALGLDIDPNYYVNSPTFTIINQYSAKTPIYHIDLYRIESFAEMDNLGLEEIIYGQGITIIEWAEKLFHGSSHEKSLYFPLDSHLEISMEMLVENQRLLKIKPLNMKHIDDLLFTLQKRRHMA